MNVANIGAFLDVGHSVLCPTSTLQLKGKESQAMIDRNMSRRALVVGSIVFLITLSCSIVSWRAISKQYPVYQGSSGSTVIVFTSDADAGRQLYAISPNGENLARLTYHRGSGLFGLPIGGYSQDLVINEQPLPGPDMKGVRYISNFEREGFKQYYLPLNGDRYIQLPPTIEDYTYASLSPDGQLLLYINRDKNFVIKNVQTGEERCINCDLPEVWVNTPASWTLDSKKFVVSWYSPSEGVSHIYTYATATNMLTQISPKTASVNRSPSWSPDGRRIAFASNLLSDDPDKIDIYVMNIDDKQLSRLTDTGNNTNPAWSPDGKNIVFESKRNGRVSKHGNIASDIYLMKADGSEQVQLTRDSASTDYTVPIWVIIP